MIILPEVFCDCSQSLQEIRFPGTLLKVRAQPLLTTCFRVIYSPIILSL